MTPNEPEWEHVNSALHYPTVQAAQEAAVRAGAFNAEVHATLLSPLVYDSLVATVIDVRITDSSGAATSAAESIPESVERLGFDVVRLGSGTDLAEGDVTAIDLSCAPLSCNGLGKDHPVNRWCLLDRWDDAVVAATAFARDEPEPGPYVIVEIVRVVGGRNT